jgi:glycosyltransferase involved in cell wall biosynthesis
LKVKGGISTVIKGYLSSILAKEHNLYLVASHIDAPRTIKLLKALLGLLEMLYYLLSKHIDIVHLHGGDYISFKRKYFYTKVAFAFRARVIYHHHGGGFMSQYDNLTEKWKRRVRQTFESVDLLICLSKSWRDSLQSIAPKAKIVVIPNAIDLPKTYKKQVNTPVNLTFLGWIVEKKGVFDLIQVVRKLVDDGFNIQLTIGGYGDIERLFEEINELCITSSVHYRGWITATERDLLLRTTDIFVLPSYAEAMPMSILEAMAYSVPVVSTDVGGIPELFSDGDSGFLIPPGNMNLLYEKLKQLIQNPDLRQTFGSHARQVIKKKHNMTITARVISDIYESL